MERDVYRGITEGLKMLSDTVAAKRLQLYLLNHEDDIANRIDDYGELAQAFQVSCGRRARAINNRRGNDGALQGTTEEGRGRRDRR